MMPLYHVLAKCKATGETQDLYFTEPSREAALFTAGYFLGAHYHEAHEMVKLAEFSEDC